LHPEKTRLIEFGKFAAERRSRRGLGKPETFDFLGFTHICGGKADGSGFQLWRKTIRKRLKAKLRAIKEELRRHAPMRRSMSRVAGSAPSCAATSPTMRCRPT
jgi:RNA-directed DNA polymerase